MIKLYFTGILAIINLALMIFAFKKDFMWACLISLLAFSVCTGGLFVDCTSIPNESDVYYKIQEYNELKSQVEMVNDLKDEQIRNIFMPDLRKKVDKMNTDILENKSRCHSKWDGILYSEEIGNLELIELL